MPIVPWPAITSGSSNGWIERQVPLAHDPERVLVGVVEVVAVQHDFAAELAHRLDLDLRASSAASRSTAGMPRRCARERDALRVIAGRGADHAARARPSSAGCAILL